MEKYTAKQTKDLLDEVLDPRKVTLICSSHVYIGEGPPTDKCKECWQVYLIKSYAKCAPHKRKEMLELLEKFVVDGAALAETGRFNVNLYPHPKVEFS